MKYLLTFFICVTAHADLKSDYEAFHACDVKSKEMWKQENICWQHPEMLGSPECKGLSRKPDCEPLRATYELHDQIKRYNYENSLKQVEAQ